MRSLKETLKKKGVFIWSIVYKAEKGIYCLLEMLRAIVLVSEFGGLNSDFVFSLNQGKNAICLAVPGQV